MNYKNIFLVLMTGFCVLFLLFYGETGFNLNSLLIWQLRFPKVVVCFFGGGILALAGLLMQIFFQNPLAGPDILGVSSGASLFVAFWMMASVGMNEIVKDWGMNIMSLAGAFLVFSILIFFVQKNVSRISLIIIGLLISSFTSSGISILVNLSDSLQLKNYLMWSMGSFRNLTFHDLPRFVFLSLLSIFPLLFFSKILNQFLLSENYAKSMGVNIKRSKQIFVSLAALQVSIVTLYCGPIGFIGIISPHLARYFHKTTDLKVLLPAVFFIGALFAFLAEIIIVLTPSWSLSPNAILGLVGSPTIIYYLYRQGKRSLGNE